MSQVAEVIGEDRISIKNGFQTQDISSVVVLFAKAEIKVGYKSRHGFAARKPILQHPATNFSV